MKGRGKKGHTACRPGKKVRLKLVDGSYVFGKFREASGDRIVLDVSGELKTWKGRDVIGLVIWKPQQHHENN